MITISLLIAIYYHEYSGACDDIALCCVDAKDDDLPSGEVHPEGYLYVPKSQLGEAVDR